MMEIKTFSRDKHHQQDSKWILEQDLEDPKIPAEKHVAEKPVEEKKPAPSGSSFRPPSIIVETKVPNVLVESASTDFHTVVVVQHDDPEKVAQILASLKKSIIPEVDQSG